MIVNKSYNRSIHPESDIPHKGDKYVLTIDEVVETSSGYLAKVEGFNSLVFDSVGLSKLKSLSSVDSDPEFEKVIEKAVDARCRKIVDDLGSQFSELEGIAMFSPNKAFKEGKYVRFVDIYDVLSSFNTEHEEVSDVKEVAGDNISKASKSTT